MSKDVCSVSLGADYGCNEVTKITSNSFSYILPVVGTVNVSENTTTTTASKGFDVVVISPFFANVYLIGGMGLYFQKVDNYSVNITNGVVTAFSDTRNDLALAVLLGGGYKVIPELSIEAGYHSILGLFAQVALKI